MHHSESDVLMEATGPAIAELSPSMILAGVAWRLTISLSGSATGAGAERTPMKTLARAKTDRNFMLKVKAEC